MSAKPFKTKHGLDGNMQLADKFIDYKAIAEITGVDRDISLSNIAKSVYSLGLIGVTAGDIILSEENVNKSVLLLVDAGADDTSRLLYPDDKLLPKTVILNLAGVAVDVGTISSTGVVHAYYITVLTKCTVVIASNDGGIVDFSEASAAEHGIANLNFESDAGYGIPEQLTNTAFFSATDNNSPPVLTAPRSVNMTVGFFNKTPNFMIFQNGTLQDLTFQSGTGVTIKPDTNAICNYHDGILSGDGASAGVRVLASKYAYLLEYDNTTSGLTGDKVQDVIDELAPSSGATGSRPAASSVLIGYPFFDTTLGHPIWSDGTNWVDATGSTV